MIINSQFFMCQYNGKQPLPLMEIPESLDSDAIKRSEYNKFIQSIDSIYATQDIDGNIPKFWTTRTQQTDALGNISYKYVPHPESTLENLSSATSYYFILRDSTLLPIKIPVIGGEIIGFSDISSLPTVNGISSCNGLVTECSGTSKTCCRSVSASGNNFVDIIFNLSNLRPLESYSYSIESVGANWPVNVNPASGIFRPAKSDGQIKIDAIFCPTTGLCGSNILTHNIDNDSLLKNNSIKYANIQLTLRPSGYSDSNLIINSDHYSILCENCLPTLPILSLSSPVQISAASGTPEPTRIIPAEDHVSIIEDYFDGLAYDEFNLNINELEISPRDKKYSYSIETLSADHPIVFITPTGGVINVRQGTTGTYTNIKFFLCPSTGLCLPGSGFIPSYSIPSYPKFLIGEDSIAGVINVKIRASVEHYDYPGQKVYSNTRVVSFIR